MTKDTTTVTLKDIQKIVQQIVGHCHPQKVILFGSYAHGTPTADSDVDLLVVMETDVSPAERFLTVSRLVRPRPFPLDVIVKTPARCTPRLRRAIRS